MLDRYTPAQLARLLSNFHAINGVLYGRGITVQDNYTPQSDENRKHATSVANGKEQARRKEELLCMMIDLQAGLEQVHPSVRRTLLNHYVYETHIVARERRGYLRSCLRRLARVLNEE